MSVLYFLICRVIFKTAKFRKQVQTRKADEIGVNSTTNLSNFEIEQGVSTSDITLDTSTTDARKQDTTRKQSDMDKELARRRASNRDSSNSRITKVFLAITIAFGISFIPTISMMILESTRANFWFTLTDQEYVGIMFLYTFYIFNNFVNPFMYIVMDEKFKEEVNKLHIRQQSVSGF